MHTILGANGQIATEIARALYHGGTRGIRLVSRTPRRVNATDTLAAADLTHADMADKAVLHHHSTTEQAARCALDAGAGRLLVGHYSARITDFAAYLEECRRIFPATDAVNDGDTFEF